METGLKRACLDAWVLARTYVILSTAGLRLHIRQMHTTLVGILHLCAATRLQTQW